MTLEYAETHRQKQYVEDLVGSPTGKEGEDISRAHIIERITGGKERMVKLSQSDLLTHEGWDADRVKKVQKGEVLFDRLGGMYMVASVKKGEITLKDWDEAAEDEESAEIIGSIRTSSRRIRAHEYGYKINSSMGKHKVVKILDMAYKDRSLDTMEFFDELIRALPAQHFNSVDEIRIFKQPAGGVSGVSKKGCGVMLKPNVIDLYLDEDSYDLEFALETLYHELGHAIAKAVKGSAHPGKIWKRAMDSDANYLSAYAEKARYPKLGDRGEVEDFAEAVRLYLSTDGAQSNRDSKLRQECESRFKILDELFGNPIYQQQFATRRLISRLLKKKSPLG